MGRMDVGIDLVAIERFRDALAQKKDQFLHSTFSGIELEYCLSYSDPAPHLAGTFAAKEAVRKATGESGAFSDTEIRRSAGGKPEVWLRGVRAPSILLSITHTETDACAVAIAQNI